MAHAVFAERAAEVPESQWRQFVGADAAWTIGVVVRHVAWGYGFQQHYFDAIASGQPLPPVVQSDFDTLTMQVSRPWGTLSKSEVLASLAGSGAATAEWLYGLSHEQLDRCGQFFDDDPTLSVREWIEDVLLTHPASHLADIRITPAK